MARTLPPVLPDDDDLDAEEATLAAEDAAATLTPREARRESPGDRVARVLADLGIDTHLGAPPVDAVGARPVAASLLAWSEDPVATLPPLRLPHRSDPGDVAASGGFALAALARAVAPDLAARGWRGSAGSLVLSGARASEDDIAEAVATIVREAASAPERVEALTVAAWSGGPSRRFGPSPRYAERLRRLEAHSRRTATERDRDGTGARAARAWHDLTDAATLADRLMHDDFPGRFVRVLWETLGDLVTPRARRALAASLRSALPAAPVADVEDLGAARSWLASLSGPVIPRPGLFDAYVAAGAPGNLDKRALLPLAAEVLGEPRRRASGFVFVVGAAA